MNVLFLAQPPNDGEGMATFNSMDQPALLQCLHGAGIRGQRTDYFTIFQFAQNGIAAKRVRFKLVAVLHLGEQVLLPLREFRRNICRFLLRHRFAEGLVLYSGSRTTGVSGRQQTP
jgi:hypothetical protein